MTDDFVSTCANCFVSNKDENLRKYGADYWCETCFYHLAHCGVTAEWADLEEAE